MKRANLRFIGSTSVSDVRTKRKTERKGRMNITATRLFGGGAGQPNKKKYVKEKICQRKNMSKKKDSKGRL